MNGRYKWIDSVRFISIMLVVLTHFVAAVYPEGFRYWHEGVSGVILCGINGKLAVAMFAIILGYFSAHSAEKQNFHLAEYICKRYVRFFVVMFLTVVAIQVMIVIFGVLGIENSAVNTKENFFVGKAALSVAEIFSEVLALEASSVPFFWCMDDYFYTSVIIAVICSLFKGNKRILAMVLVIVALMAGGRVWTGIGCVGGVVHEIKNHPYATKIKARALFLILFIIFKVAANNISENNVLYVLSGAVCAAGLILLFDCDWIKKKLELHFMVTGGEISFYIYASHVPIIYVFGYYLIDFLRCYMSFKIAFFITFMATAVLIYGIAYFLYQIIEQKMISSLFRKVFR